MHGMDDLRNRLTNALRSGGDRLRNEPAVLIAIGIALVHVATGADQATLEEFIEVAASERTWELAAILLGGGVVRQSVFSKRTHEVDREIDAMGDESA